VNDRPVRRIQCCQNSERIIIAKFDGMLLVKRPKVDDVLLHIKVVVLLDPSVEPVHRLNLRTQSTDLPLQLTLLRVCLIHQPQV